MNDKKFKEWFARLFIIWVIGSGLLLYVAVHFLGKYW